MAAVLCGVAGLTILGFVGSIAAIILGRQAVRDIRRDQLRGEQLARLGIVLGTLGLVVVVVVIGVFVGQRAV